MESKHVRGVMHCLRGLPSTPDLKLRRTLVLPILTLFKITEDPCSITHTLGAHHAMLGAVETQGRCEINSDDDDVRHHLKPYCLAEEPPLPSSSISHNLGPKALPPFPPPLTYVGWTFPPYPSLPTHIGCICLPSFLHSAWIDGWKGLPPSKKKRLAGPSPRSR